MKTTHYSEGVTHYTFRKKDVITRNITGFLRLYDPLEFTQAELQSLFGSLTFELEGLSENRDWATIPEARRLLHALHMEWPWMGYFLDLNRPFGPSRTLCAVPMLAHTLCVVTPEIHTWDKPSRSCVRVNPDHLLLLCKHAFVAIDFLGEAAEISQDALLARKDEVLAQITCVL